MATRFVSRPLTDIGYDPQKAYRLIFDFHGKGGTPQGQYENSQYYKYPQASDYLVAYPLGDKANDGSGDNAWQDAPYAAPGVNDIGFTSDLINHINDNYCVDTTKIYASGKSNGGGFVDLLACSDIGDKFAAFAMAAPALYTDTSGSPCVRKLRKIIHAHGLQDDTARYDGGTSHGQALPSIADWLGRWASNARDGCSGPQYTSDNGNTLITYTPCSGGITNAIKSYRLPNGGHCWPDGRSDNTDGARSDCKDQSLDFTSKVLDFFAARHL